MKEIISIVSIIIISLLIALGGSYKGFMMNDTPIILHCLFIAYSIQLFMFFPSYIYKTERFFDLAGSVTFMSIIFYIFYNRNISDLNYTGLMLFFLIFLWTLRLGLFLFNRINKDGSDRRFNKIKTNFLKFLLVWILQGFWVFVTGSCAITVLCSINIDDNFTFMIIGFIIWLSGFIIEVIADFQKRNFRKNNQEKFINSGLWFYSRHPNYLGEILLWFGISVICYPNLEGTQLVSLISPIFVYILLKHISGINLLEQYADQKWGKLESYQKYKLSTPILFPLKNTYLK